MQSLKAIAKQEGFTKFPVSIRQVFQKYGVHSAFELIAYRNVSRKMAETYRRAAGSASQLGSPTGGLKFNSDGSFTKEFALGSLSMASADSLPVVRYTHQASVEIAAVKCFGTDDVNTDEPFVIVSVVSLDPWHEFPSSVTTFATNIQDDTHAGDVIFEGIQVTTVPINVTGSGLHIAVALYDHESGNVDDLKNDINNFMVDAAKKGLAAISGAAAGANPALDGPIGDALDFEIGGVKPFRFLTLGVSDFLAHLLGDDLIGTKVFILNEADLLNIEAHPEFRSDVELHAQDVYNVPTPAQFPDSLITNGDGTYRVYFRVRVRKTERPITLPTVT